MGKKARKKHQNVTSLFEYEEDFFEQGRGGRKARSKQNSHQKQTNSGSKYRKNIEGRSPNQWGYIDLLRAKDFVGGEGVAGSGKTYLAVAVAIEQLKDNYFDKIVLTRPAVEAGEKLGYLPGGPMEKLDPFLQPLYDAILERMPAQEMNKLMYSKKIEIAPVAYLRGRTLSNAFIIVDEAQNCTYSQLKMIFSRLGTGSRMVFTGDPTQDDLEDMGLESGFVKFMEKLKSLDDKRMGFAEMGSADIVRHPLLKDTMHLL